MKPYYHARLSVKRYGGVIEDYLEIHNFIDSSKSALADVRHRALMHSSFGCFIVEKVYGVTLENSAGKVVQVRDLAEDHVQEDLGFVPSVDKWLRNMRIEPWMSGARKRQTTKQKRID